MPSPSDDFKPVECLEAEIKSEDIIHVLVSDRNHLYDPLPFSQLICWVANKCNFRVDITSAWLKYTIELEHLLRGKKEDSKKAEKEAYEKEQHKVNQTGREMVQRLNTALYSISRSISHRDSPGNIPATLRNLNTAAEKIGYAKERVDVKALTKILTTEGPDRDRALKNYLLLAKKLAEKKGKFNAKFREEVNILVRQCIPKIPYEKSSPFPNGKKWAHVVPESGITATKPPNPNYARCQKYFEDCLQKIPELQKKYKELIDELTEERMTYYFEKNSKDIKIPQQQWMEEKRKQAEEKYVEPYVRIEIPRFLQIMDQARETFEKYGVTTWIAYPWKNSKKFFELAYYVDKTRGREHSNAFKFLDVTYILDLPPTFALDLLPTESTMGSNPNLMFHHSLGSQSPVRHQQACRTLSRR